MANDLAPWLKDFAILVLRSEETGGGATESRPAFSACEKLRHPLNKMLGAQGFQSLLARAVALAGAKAPWLRSLRATSKGVLDGLVEVRPQPDRQTLADGEALILGELLGLLVIFIGPSVTQGLVQETWPDVKTWKV